MIKTISLKTKLIVPGFVLVVIILLFGVIIASYQYNKISSLTQLHEKIILSNYISDTLHSLQKERGLSSGFINNRNEFKNELLDQRKIVDKNIKKILSKEYRDYTQSSLLQLKNITAIRDSIDSSSLAHKDIIKGYSSVNDSLLDAIVIVAKSSHIPTITQDIIAYTNLLYLKENSGLQRALGVMILSANLVESDSIVEFITLKALKKQNIAMFLKYASSEISSFYNESIKTDSFIKTQRLENQIINFDFLMQEITPKDWYNTSTKHLNTLDRISKFIKLQTLAKIMYELEEANKYFYFIIAIVISGLMIFLTMLITFLKLAKEEQRLRIVQEKYVISSITDLQGKILDASEAFCSISGYTKKELLGKPHSIIRHPDMPKSAFKEMWENIQNGKSWKGKVKNLKKNGSFYWVYANIEPLYNTKGNIDSYISVRLDITENEILMQKVQKEEEKNKIQEKLMQQQHKLAQMGEMINMIAHQWRQPLSAISATSGSITIKARMNKLEMQTAVMLSDKITGFALHLSSTIDDFRNFFKSDKAKQGTDYKVVVESVLRIVENSLKENNIELIQHIDKVEKLFTYENELKQVLLNLIKNAEDALVDNSIADPKIIITVQNNTLTVSDNAGGIQKDILDKIFEPYFSTKTKKDGTGLGLYMSKMIIEEHCAGRLYVTNEKDGAKFTIILKRDDD